MGMKIDCNDVVGGLLIGAACVAAAPLGCDCSYELRNALLLVFCTGICPQ